MSTFYRLVCHEHREILPNGKGRRRLTGDELRDGVGGRVIVAQPTVLDKQGTRIDRSRNLSEGENNVIEDLRLVVPISTKAG
jgi:hypothetical protein